MAKKEFISNNARFTIKYRAVCLKGDYKGPPRDSEYDADYDAFKHQNKFPTHKVEIEIEQTQSMRIKFNKKDFKVK